jgi:hypothetical protein
MITKTDIKFWITIMAIVVSATIWGIRLEGKVNTTISLLEDQRTRTNNLTISINDLWRQVTVLNTLHDR